MAAALHTNLCIKTSSFVKLHLLVSVMTLRIPDAGIIRAEIKNFVMDSSQLHLLNAKVSGSDEVAYANSSPFRAAYSVKVLSGIRSR